MPVFRESVSSPAPRSDDTRATLISGVNWLGDSVMTMPALFEWKCRHAENRLVVLCKPGLVPLWKMAGWVDDVLPIGVGPVGAFVSAWRASAGKFGRAFIMTQSFRSALIPFLARVPCRVGMHGHSRDWMLSSVATPTLRPGREHQAFEYFDLMGMPECADLRLPQMSIPAEISSLARKKIKAMLAPGIKGPVIGMMPGAARGPAKQWPREHFAALAKRLVVELDCGIILFGTHTDYSTCLDIASAAGVGDRLVNFAGATSLPDLAALLAECRLTVANDSGGMHLTAAVGTTVVALFGLTDPMKTRPIGDRHRILTAENAGPVSRDIEVDSTESRMAMASIKPDRVFSAIAAEI